MALFSITLASTPPASALDATSALTPIEEHGIFSENSPNYWEVNPILSPENRQNLYQWRQVQVIIVQGKSLFIVNHCNSFVIQLASLSKKILKRKRIINGHRLKTVAIFLAIYLI